MPDLTKDVRNRVSNMAPAEFGRLYNGMTAPNKTRQKVWARYMLLEEQAMPQESSFNGDQPMIANIAKAGKAMLQAYSRKGYSLIAL